MAVVSREQIPEKKKLWGPSSHGSSTISGGGGGGGFLGRSSNSLSNIIAESNHSSSSPSNHHHNTTNTTTTTANGTSKTSTVERRREQVRSSAHEKMAPPPINGNKTLLSPSAHHPMMREITEDTPADLLEGTMDLLVILPSKSSVRMTVNRRTPMMDLLIQVTTANKINPGGHIVLVRNERGSELRYKPSTPIGVLDTTTIEIVPKNQVNEYIIVKKQPANKPANQPFEQTFRLQVHLPRNQLYVMRVGSKTILQDILDEVCAEKNLDISKYELRHPANLDEKLLLSNSLGDYGLQQVTVVSKNSKTNNTCVSSADILALQQSTDDGRNKGSLDSAFKYSRSSVGDSSVSSESAGSGCGISPSRSDDDSRSISPLPPPILRSKLKLNNTVSNASSSSEASSSSNLKSTASISNTRMDELLKPKKRAPLPPGQKVGGGSQTNLLAQSIEIENGGTRKKDAAPKDPPRPLTKHQSLPPAQNHHHSRHSSDSSSGYHESSPSIILSDGQESSSRRNERPLSVQQMSSSYGSSSVLSKGTATSLTNLTSVSSLSSTSLASSNGGTRNKRKAPRPPAGFTLQAQTELEEEFTTTDSEVGGGGASAQNTASTPPAFDSKSKIIQNDVNPKTTTQSASDVNYAAKNNSTETYDDEDQDFVVQKRKPLHLTQRSSSSMSSLNSPTPPSESNSSSPLPLDLAAAPSITKTKRIVPSPAAAVAAAEFDNAGSTSSSNHNQVHSTSSSATNTLPMAPPRTARSKPKDSKQQEQSQTQDNNNVNIIQPKPKPRPDRSKNNELENASSAPALTNAANNSKELITNKSSNSMTRIGVKVLPDNALQERAARFNRLSSSYDNDNNNGESNRMKNQQQQQHDVDDNTQNKMLSSSNKQNTNDPNVDKVHLPLTQRQSVGSAESFPTSSLEDYDSDNLEENLELFEIKGENRKQSSSQNINMGEIVNNVSSKNSSSTFPRTKNNNTISNSQSLDDDDDSLPSSSPAKESTNKLSGQKSYISSVSDGNNDENVNKTTRTGGGEEIGQLNRWKNHESLDVIEVAKANNKRMKPKEKQDMNNKITASNNNAKENPSKKSNPAFSSEFDETNLSSSSSDIENSGGEPSDEINTLHASSSSSSEHSYSADDSGIPTTANITPSPISLEHDDNITHHDPNDGGNLNTKDSLPLSTSPTHSDHSEIWREILQSKVEHQDSNVDKALETMDFKDETDTNNIEKSKVANNFEMSTPESMKKISSSNVRKSGSENYENDDELSTTSDDDDDKGKEQSKKKNSNARKISKSESFSQSTEHELKSKRKTFAESHAVSNRNTSSNLKKNKSSSYLSSSEEDLHHNHKDDVDETTKRYTSMQNLSSEKDEKKRFELMEIRRNNAKAAKNGGEKELEGKGIRKATSVIGMENLEPEITQNPNLMQTFQVELEAQFEQWKEQFLQKHLNKSGSKDEASSSSNEEQQQKETPVSNLEVVKAQESTEKHQEETTNKLDNNKATFDPEKPQVVHSVAGVSDLRHRNPTLDSDDKATSTQTTQAQVEVEANETLEETHQEHIEVSAELQENLEEEMSGIAPPEGNGQNSPQVYRYSGPPAIQMGTWGERPRGNISVKNDTDYKMGMGQYDAKSSSNEFRPMLGSIATRVHSFNGGAIASPMLNKSTTLPSTRSSSSIVPKVVTNWKEKVESSHKEKVSTTPTPTTEKQQDKEEKPNSEQNFNDVVIRKSASVTNTLERPSKPKANFTISSASSTLERPTKKLNPPTVIGIQSNGKSEASSSSLWTNGSQNDGANKRLWPENNNSLEKRVDESFRPNTLEKSKPSNNVTTVILNENQSNGHSTANSTSSLKDKKAFFQGIKPVESPTKEVPLPAVNMKNNIATIQQVFEARQAMKNLAEAGKKDSRGHSPSPSVSSTVSVSSLSSNSSTTPELIGGTSQSTIMVQKLLKGNSFNIESFRRTPTPTSISSSSSVSIGSSTTHDQRHSNPSPTILETSSSKTKLYQPSVTSIGPTPVKSNNNNTTSDNNNKAIIIIGSDSSGNGISNNMFKQQLKVTGGGSGGTPKEVIINPSSALAPKPVKLHVNGTNNTSSSSKPQVISISMNEPEKQSNSYGGITLKNTRDVPKVVEIHKPIGNNAKVSLNKRNSGPMELAGLTPPPPPPPPVMPESGGVAKHPNSISINSERKLKSSFSSPGSTPSSPISPSGSDPRADIFSAIKNSGGNFKLKKTGSTMLLR